MSTKKYNNFLPLIIEVLKLIEIIFFRNYNLEQMYVTAIINNVSIYCSLPLYAFLRGKQGEGGRACGPEIIHCYRFVSDKLPYI